jgi:hypothetical protein
MFISFIRRKEKSVYLCMQGRREALRAGGGYFQKWEKDVVQSNSAWE